MDYALSYGIDAIEERVTALAQRLRGRLVERPGITVHDQGQRRCAIVTFSVDGVPASTVQQYLSQAGINTSVSETTSAQFDFPGRGLTEIVRASVHYYNTDDEIARLRDALDSLPAAPA